MTIFGFKTLLNVQVWSPWEVYFYMTYYISLSVWNRVLEILLTTESEYWEYSYITLIFLLNLSTRSYNQYSNRPYCVTHIMMEDRVQSASQIVKDHDKHLAKRDQEKCHTAGTDFWGSGHTLRTSCRWRVLSGCLECHLRLLKPTMACTSNQQGQPERVILKQLLVY